MKIIACVDDLGGMMFNNRRQSRDRILVEDVVRTSRGSTLYIDEYSKALFADFEGSYTVAQNMLDVATGADFCFVENKRLGGIADRINEIILYRWNRRYPSDFKFDIDLEAEGFCLCEASEFAGYSHEKITKEVYRR